jgi:hypothetical protein
VFDGVDDTVSFSAITLGSTFTISQTLVASGTYQYGYMPIGGGLAISGGTYKGYVWFNTNSSFITTQLIFAQDGEAGGFNFTLPSSIPRYTLFQYTLVKNGSTANFYINGTLITSQSVESARNFTVRNLGWSYSSYYMNRNLYNTQIYNRALTQAEISQNYYQAPIVTDGLVFAVDAGNVVSYISGSTTTYSLTGSASGSLVNGTGYSNINNGTWVFDGVDDYITLTRPVQDDFTLSCWFKTNQTGSLPTQWYLGKGLIDCEVGNIQNDFGLGIGGGRVIYGIGNQATQVDVSIYSTTLYNDNIWHNAVATRVKSTGAMLLYVDSVLVASGSAQTGSLTSSTDMRIGSQQTNVGFFLGNIATGVVYNRALSSQEVLQNYNAQKGRFGL